jgi:transposase-like protein
MAQYQLTLDGEFVQELFTRGDGMAKLLEQVLNQVLAAQVTEQLGAAPYERSEGRTGYRNGTRTRPLTTRIGQLELAVPRVRGGEFSTELFARYQRSEQALLIVMVEMVINGVSTRKVTNVVEELCGEGFSKSTVSELCKRLDPIVAAWKGRDLGGRSYPFVLVDGLVIKVREGGRVRAQSALIASGISAEGQREILGFWIGDSESEATWSAFFRSLKERGLAGVELVVSDSHAGLVKALETQFQGASWQRCQTHLTRNLSDACPKAVWPDLYPRLQAMFRAPDLAAARKLRDDLLDQFGARAPKAMALLEEAFDAAMAVMALPARYRVRLRTTNGMERTNEEIRKRERVIRIFPNAASAVRLLGAILMEIDEAWTTGKRYFDMAEYWQWRRSRPSQPTQGAPIAESQAA